MPFPSARSYLGLGLEATKGTAVVPSDYIPWKTWQPFDDVMYLEDNGIRGSMVDLYGEIAGIISASHDLGGDVIADTFGFLLAGILGDVVTTGASAPFTHVMAVKNATDGQPKSFTLTDYYGMGATTSRQFRGCQMSELTVTFSADGLLGYTSKILGYRSTVVANPTAGFTAVGPMPAWEGVCTIAGGAITKIESAEISLKRNGTPITAVTGTQDPYAIFVGPLRVTGKMTLVHEDDSELVRYLTNTQPAVVLDFTQGAGAALVDVKFQMTKGAYTVGRVNHSGKDWVETEIEFNAVANATDVGASLGVGPVLATIKSAKPAATYQ